MNRGPEDKTATPRGRVSTAIEAGPLSPSCDEFELPMPASVQMIPELSIIRTRSLSQSVNTRSPDELNAKYAGELRLAAVAAIPSPLNPMAPLPAAVVMLPVAASTRRIRPLPMAARYKL